MQVSCTPSIDKIFITDNIDLGNISIGRTYDVNLCCVNKSFRTINIKEIIVSCSCLRFVERIEGRIESQDTLWLNLQYYPYTKGYVERHIEVYLEDIEDPIFVKLSAFVK